MWNFHGKLIADVVQFSSAIGKYVFLEGRLGTAVDTQYGNIQLLCYDKMTKIWTHPLSHVRTCSILVHLFFGNVQNFTSTAVGPPLPKAVNRVI